MSNPPNLPQATVQTVGAVGADLNEPTIKQFLSQNFLIDFKADANQDTDLFDQGFIDSYGYVELIKFLEKQFKIRFTDEELLSRELRTLHSIVAIVGKKLNAN